MLEIENLHAGYRRVRVLHDVTLSVATGEAVGVLGPNGAGKTTLLRAIAGICTVYGGRIRSTANPITSAPRSASPMSRKGGASGPRSRSKRI